MVTAVVLSERAIAFSTTNFHHVREAHTFLHHKIPPCQRSAYLSPPQTTTMSGSAVAFWLASWNLKGWVLMKSSYMYRPKAPLFEMGTHLHPTYYSQQLMKVWINIELVSKSFRPHFRLIPCKIMQGVSISLLEWPKTRQLLTVEFSVPSKL